MPTGIDVVCCRAIVQEVENEHPEIVVEDITSFKISECVSSITRSFLMLSLGYVSLFSLLHILFSTVSSTSLT